MRVIIHLFIFAVHTALCLARRKNLIIDTDLFSDVDDAAAIMLAATAPEANLLAVNINYPSTFSAMTASAILSHYHQPQVPIGIKRPLTNDTFFDSWSYQLGEYTSKIAYHFSGGSIPWGHAEDASNPVELYRKLLAEADDNSVTIVSIGFLDNLSALLNSTGDSYSKLTGRELLSQKVAELIVMGGAYPSGREYNFFGSDPALTAHTINTWDGPIVFVGDEVGADVFSGALLMKEGPSSDPVRQAYIYYSYFSSRPSWDSLAILYAIHGLGNIFEIGNEYGYNYVDPLDGRNRWVWDKAARSQKYLLLKIDKVTAGEAIDCLLLNGALKVVEDIGTGKGASCDQEIWREDL